jgi:ribosomal protein S18 acetylase RimI-like enzyme
MRIRPFAAPDISRLVDITIESFRPFFDDYVHPLLGDELFQYQHGHWKDDYRRDIPTLHAPAAGRHLAVAEVDDSISGFVSWKVGARPDYGQIYLLAVLGGHRRRHLGRALCEHATSEMRADGVSVVGIGTGDDVFHAPARAFDESLGFTKIPTAAYLRTL